jgi:hypothetical protein
MATSIAPQTTPDAGRWVHTNCATLLTIVNTKAKIIGSIPSHTPYLEWARAGLRPADIKAEILDVLRPHFRNTQILEALPITILAHEAVVVASIDASAWSSAALARLLDEYREALAANREACLDGFEAWNEVLVRGTSEFISLYLMEVDKTDLSNEETRLEVLRNIGGLLEACVQPHLKAALHLIRVRGGHNVDVADVDARKFGVVVEDFSRVPGFDQLMAPTPWRIKLHHWRNIAQHHAIRIVNGRFICEYRVGTATHRIELSRDELLAVARAMQTVLSVLRVARSIFVLDNGIEPRNDVGLELRQEAYLLEFFSGIATQGFEVTAVELSDEMAHLYVKDVTDQDPKARGIHASQFVVGLWIHYERPIVRVTYSDRQGKKYLEATARGQHCQRIADKVEPFEILANCITFRVLLPNTEPVTLDPQP